MAAAALVLALLVTVLSSDVVFGAPEKGCGNNPADIVFVLDESGSIWGPHFTKQLDFVQSVIESLDVGFNKTHIGVLTFGTNERIIFPLGKYTSEAELKAAIKTIKQKRGETYTHLALRTTRTEMFSRQYSRPWVRHVAIIITDGESNYPDLTVKEADLGHRENIQMFAVGVGTAVVMKELRAIASSEDLVFKVDGYEALEELRTILAWKACEPPTTTPPPTTTTPEPPPQMIEGCNGQRKMDHIWSISNQANAEETNHALEFIQSLIGEMKIDPLHVQVGLAPRDCDTWEAVHFKDHDTREGFSSELERRKIRGQRSLDKSIQYIHSDGINPSNGARSDAVKYGILIVDNRVEDWGNTLQEAASARDRGVHLIVIGVGGDIDESQLRQLGSSYFYASSYSRLADLKSELIKTFCQGITTGRLSPKRLLERFFDYSNLR